MTILLPVYTPQKLIKKSTPLQNNPINTYLETTYSNTNACNSLSISYNHYLNLKNIAFKANLSPNSFETAVTNIKNDISAGKYLPQGIDPNFASDITEVLKPDNLELFNCLLQLKTTDEQPLMGYSLITALDFGTDQDISFVKQLASLKTFDQTNNRLDSYEVSQALKIKPEARQTLLDLLNLLTPDKSDFLMNTKGTDLDDGIDYIYERLSDQNKELTLFLAQATDVNGHKIIKTPFDLSGAINENTDKLIPALKELINKGMTSEEILLYCALSKKNLQNTLDDFIDAKKRGQIDNEFFKKSSHGFYFPEEYDPVLIKRLLEAKNPDGTYKVGCGEYDHRIFNYALTSNHEFVQKLLEDRPDKPIFSAENLFMVLLHKDLKKNGTKRDPSDYEKMVEYMLEHKNKVNTHLSGNDIADLLELESRNLPIKAFLNDTPPELLTIKEKNDFLHFQRALLGKKNIPNNYYRMLKQINTESRWKNISEMKNLETLELKALGFNDKKINKAYNPAVEDVQKLNSAIEKLDPFLETTDITQFGETGIPLAFSRQDFIENTTKILQNSALTADEKEIIQSYFGFSVENCTLNGFPTPENTDPKVIDAYLEMHSFTNKILHPTDFIKTIQDVSTVVKDFTVDNAVQLPDNPVLSDTLTTLITTLPEFASTIGRKQHGVHAYTLDVHMLETVKNLVKQPEYLSLPPKEKYIAKMATIIHDLTKQEAIVDPAHPETSEIAAYKALKRSSLNPGNIQRICTHIKNHHWVERLDKNMIRPEDLAVEFRKPHDFDIAIAISKADLLAVGNTTFSDRFKNAHQPYLKPIQEKIDLIHSSGTILPQTKIPKASKLNLPETQLGLFDQITNNKVVLIDPKTNFEQIGFEPGTSFDNISFIMHATNNHQTFLDSINFLEKEGKDGILSTSYATGTNYVPFHNPLYTFVFEVDQNNIALTHGKSVGSGGEKNYELFKNYLYKQKDPQYRDTFVEKFCKNLNIPRDEYKNIFKMLSDKHSLMDIPLKYRDALQKTVKEISLIQDHTYNETVAYAPRLVGIATKATNNADLSAIPYNVRKHCEENDLPILCLTQIK